MEVVRRSRGIATLSLVVGLGCFGLGWLGKGQAGGIAVICALGSIGLAGFAGSRLVEHFSRPLVTAANLLDALRHGDYMHRARTDGVSLPVAGLLREVNELAEHLEAERLHGHETSALLETLIQKIDIALLAFDEHDQLVWWNAAASRAFQPRLTAGASAVSLDAARLLRGASERSVSLDGLRSPAAWELRRGTFFRESKRYQFVLLSSAHRLRREEERAAWQRLVRVLSHEVNNTLTPIHSLAGTCREMLSDVVPEDLRQLQQALTAIEHRSASLGEFISEFAHLARLPEPQPVPMDLADAIARIAALDTRCPVKVVSQGKLVVLGDAPLLEQAFANLIRNAVDAAVACGGKVEVQWFLADDEVTLLIVDEGSGISNPENLFVPLFSTKKGGSGIGLILSRNIVEAHDGQLLLENRSDAKGCVARVTLPRA